MKEIHDFTIVKNVQLSEKYFLLAVQHAGNMQPVEPGQFVEVLVPGEREVMLRRPISVHDVDPKQQTISMVIQIVGKGTRRLSLLREGERLNMVYPLGHGFTTDIPTDSKVLMVGGGAGIAPLFHLSRCLAVRGIKPHVLLGGRNVGLIPVRDAFLQFSTLGVATDDGSYGYHGLVTEHPDFKKDYDIIYTCGPTPMMKAVARSARERGIRCEASLENMMACGIGACLCCVTMTESGHRCVCKDGPVFDASTLTEWYN